MTERNEVMFLRKVFFRETVYCLGFVYGERRVIHGHYRTLEEAMAEADKCGCKELRKEYGEW